LAEKALRSLSNLPKPRQDGFQQSKTNSSIHQRTSSSVWRFEKLRSNERRSLDSSRCHSTMPDWIDFTPDLQDQALCTRLFCWPCHSSIALCNAVGNCDCCGVLKVMFCCPVRRTNNRANKRTTSVTVRNLSLTRRLYILYCDSAELAVPGVPRRRSSVVKDRMMSRKKFLTNESLKWKRRNERR
jgi:hypothetical protein